MATENYKDMDDSDTKGFWDTFQDHNMLHQKFQLYSGFSEDTKGRWQCQKMEYEKLCDAKVNMQAYCTVI